MRRRRLPGGGKLHLPAVHKRAAQIHGEVPRVSYVLALMQILFFCLPGLVWFGFCAKREGLRFAAKVFGIAFGIVALSFGYVLLGVVLFRKTL